LTAVGSAIEGANTNTRVIAFLGLGDIAEIVAGVARFRLGVLYPYSRDLQRVCATADALALADPGLCSVLLGESAAGDTPPLEQPPVVMAFLASVATLYDRIAFAPGPARELVGAAYNQASDAATPHTGRRRY
jgi:hypothetical protein